MSYEYQPRREARAGRIDGSARNVQHTADGRRVVGLTSSQRSMQEGAARRAAAAQSPLQQSMRERQQRVLLAKQDGSFAAKQETFNRNSRDQWMNDSGDILNKSDVNPYRDGGQVGGAQLPSGGGGPQDGGNGGNGGVSQQGQSASPAPMGQGTPSAPVAGAAAPSVPQGPAAPPKPASNRPPPPAKNRIVDERGDQTQAVEKSLRAKGRVMDGDRDVTAEIGRGLGGDRKGQFYTGKPEPAPLPSPEKSAALMAGAEAPKTIQMTGEKIFDQGVKEARQATSGPVSRALSQSYPPLPAAGSPSALLAGAEKNPALLKPAKPLQNAKI